MRGLALGAALLLALGSGEAAARPAGRVAAVRSARLARLRDAEQRLARQVVRLAQAASTQNDRAAARAAALECGRRVRDFGRPVRGVAIAPVLRDLLVRESRWQWSALQAGRYAEVRAEARAITRIASDAARAWP